MAPRAAVKKPQNALKHGAYSTVGLLPGENASEFGDLRKAVLDELAPQGPLEEDIVRTIVRLLWRKQNLSTIRAAQWARQRRAQIIADEVARRKIPDGFEFMLPPFEATQEMQAARAEAARAGDEQAQDELGDYYELKLKETWRHRNASSTNCKSKSDWMRRSKNPSSGCSC